MLRYFSESDEGNAVEPELLRLYGIVQQARDNRKVGEQYMTLQDYLDCEIKRGVEEGVARELAEALVASLRELNIPEEKILEQLIHKCNLTEEKAKSYLNEQVQTKVTTNLII